MYDVPARSGSDLWLWSTWSHQGLFWVLGTIIAKLGLLVSPLPFVLLDPFYSPPPSNFEPFPPFILSLNISSGEGVWNLVRIVDGTVLMSTLCHGSGLCYIERNT